jgi:hypothetical protein
VVSGNLIVYAGWRYSGLSVAVASGDVARVSGATIGGFSFDETAISSSTFTSVGIWSAIATSTGSLVFRHTNGSRLRGGVIVVSGSWDGTRVEDVTELIDDSVGTTMTAGNLVSAGAALFVGAHVVDQSPAGTITPQAAWTTAYEAEDPATGAPGSMIYQVVGGATTDTPEWTFDGNGFWAAIGVAYKEGAGGGGGATIVNRESTRRGIGRGVLRGV